jgi:hypothetical protein
MSISKWHTRSRLYQRLSGFAVYQFWSLVALYDPVMADRVMLVVLKDQFSEAETEARK